MYFKRILIITVLAISLFSCSKKKKEIIPQKQEIIKKVKEIKESGEEISRKVNEKAKEIIKENKKNIQKVAQKNNLSKEQLWKLYGETKSKIKQAKMNEEFSDLIKLLKKQVQISKQLGRKDIEAWQLNNIGYYSIEEFKKRIKYDETMAKIYATTEKKKRKKLYNDLKERMKKNYKILHDSYEYLVKAQKISSQNNDKKQQKIIANNISFINDIKKMIKKAENK